MALEERKAIAESLVNFNMKRINAEHEAINKLSRPQRLLIENLPLAAQEGKRLRQMNSSLSLLGLPYSTAQNPVHRKKIEFMFNPACPHCLRVKILLEKYAKLKGQEVLLLEMDVNPQEKTDYLIAVTRGSKDVPCTIINDTYVIQGEDHFLERLTAAIQLAEVTPLSKHLEEKQIMRGI